MNRPILRFTVLILLSITFFISCTKTHQLHDYPNNYRMLGFNETTTTGPTSSPLVFNENYSFIYDDFNRVSQVIYSTNDPVVPNTIAYFTYSNDTIIKVTKNLNQTVIETDTFITDLRGFITATYMTGSITSYAYFNNLLTRITNTNGDYSLFTSYRGNFLKQTPSVSTAVNESYTYNIDMANRPGDYFQLMSFAKYGFNFYQYHNLLRSVIDPTASTNTVTTNLTYLIDADSKITRTTAVMTDSSASPLKTQVFDIQYEKYK